MADPPVVAWVETIRQPGLYSPAQVQEALRVCLILGRGKLVYLLPPDGHRGD